MFLHVTNISYCVILLTFLLKMWMFKRASYWFKGAPWVGQLLTEYRVTKLGSVFKMCRWEVFFTLLSSQRKHHSVCHFLLESSIPFSSFTIQGFHKNVQMCPPHPCIENGKNWTVRCIHEKSCQQCALTISATASRLSIITFSFAALLVLLNLFYYVPSLVQTMGHSHNCLHELVMAMLLFNVSVSQSSQHISENMKTYNSDKISLYFITVLCKAMAHTKGICRGK